MTIKSMIYGLVLVIAAPLAALAAYLIAAEYDEDRDQAIAMVAGIASGAADNLGQKIAGAESVLASLARLPAARTPTLDRCGASLTVVQRSNPGIANVTVIDREGLAVCSAVPFVDGVRPRADQTEWFQRVMHENRFVLGKPYFGRITGKLVSVFAYPVRDDNGKAIGAVTMPHELDMLLAISNPSGVRPQTTITIVDRDGTVIARHPEADWSGRTIAEFPIVRRALVGDVGAGIGLNHVGGESVYGYKSIPAAGWVAIAMLPTEVVLAPAQEKIKRAVVVVTLTLLSVFAFAAALMRRINRPIAQIAETSRAIAEGNLDARMPESSQDEFAAAARQFNAMADIRRQSTERITKLNRMYAALSRTSNAITHMSDRQHLLDEVCRIAVDTGQLALAWIGFVDPRSNLVVPAAHFGPASGYMNGLVVSIDPSQTTGHGPTGRAIRAGSPVVSADLQIEVQTFFWREAAQAAGVHSTAAVPLSLDGKIVGALNLYSYEINFFDDPELMRLLVEIATDLSFALDNLKRDAEHRESEARFCQIAENIREVFWLTDPSKGRMLYVSPGYEQIWGRSTDELYASPRTWLEAIHPDDRDHVLDAALSRQISGGYDEEYRIVRPDGTIRWIRDRAFPVRDASGAVFRVAGLADDITERKQASEALHERDRQISALIDNMPGFVYRCRNEPEWPVEFASQGVFRQTGYSPEDFTSGRVRWASIVHPDDRERIWDEVQQGLRDTGRFKLEYRIDTKEGEEKWVLEHGSGLYDAEHRLTALEGTILDVTDSRLARNRIADSERRLENVLTSITDACFVVDREFRFTYVNPVAEKLLRRPRAQLIEKHLWSEFPEAVGTPFETNAIKSMDGGEVVHFEEYYAPFESWFDVRVYPNERGLSVFFRDTTASKAAEAQLLHAQKMEALGNLAGGIAHDFNNLLLPITVLTELSRDALPSESPVRENLASVLDAAQQAALLVKQILTFGRRNEVSLAPVDISECVDEALKLLRNVLPATIDVVDQVDRNVGIVVADRAQLHSVILNLGSNAAHAMGRKVGQLTIGVARVVATRELAARCEAIGEDQSLAKLTVRDTGAGMDQATLGRIFNPFFTTKPVGEGTGLGLAMVHGIVGALGGAIEVSSEVGVGTTFYIYLPLRGDAARDSAVSGHMADGQVLAPTLADA